MTTIEWIELGIEQRAKAACDRLTEKVMDTRPPAVKMTYEELSDLDRFRTGAIVRPDSAGPARLKFMGLPIELPCEGRIS